MPTRRQARLTTSFTDSTLMVPSGAWTLRKSRPVVYFGPAAEDVGSQGLTNVCRQRQPLLSPALAWNDDFAALPVEMAKFEGSNFTCPQPIRASKMRMAQSRRPTRVDSSQLVNNCVNCSGPRPLGRWESLQPVTVG